MRGARNRMPWRVTIEAMVPQLDDLQRVLGYVEAIDDRAGTTVLGNDLFALPFWNPRFCSATACHQFICTSGYAIGMAEFGDASS